MCTCCSKFFNKAFSHPQVSRGANLNIHSPDKITNPSLGIILNPGGVYKIVQPTCACEYRNIFICHLMHPTQSDLHSSVFEQSTYSTEPQPALSYLHKTLY